MTAGTSYLFLGLLDDCSTLFQRAVFNVPDQCARALSNIPGSARFPDPDVLAGAISQQKQNGNDSSTIFVLPIKRNWYRLGTPNAERQAWATARKLRKKLPQARCLITPIITPPSSSVAHTKSTPRDYGQLSILLGTDRKGTLCATEKIQARGSELGSFEKYMIIASLTARRRAEMIWSDATLEEVEFSFGTESAICSLSADCVRDLDNYAVSAFQTGSAASNTASIDGKDYLRVHLPTIAAVLLSPARPGQSPRAVVEVLSYCLASCRPQSKTQIVAEFCIPPGPRRKRLGERLKTIIDRVLSEKGYSQELLGQLHEQAAKIHSRRHEATRNTSTLIVQRAAKLTGTSEHYFVHAKTSASIAVPPSKVCSVEQWDADFTAIQANSTKIQREEQEAQQALRQKLVGDSASFQAGSPLSADPLHEAPAEEVPRQPAVEIEAIAASSPVSA